MGAKTNHPYQLMVVKEAEYLEKDKTWKDLKPGQLGFFTPEGLSFEPGTMVGKTDSNFYIGLGVDNDGDGVVDDVINSAMIFSNHVTYTGSLAYKESKPMVIHITDIKAKCDEDYSIEVQVVNNEVLRRMGYMPYKKTYHATTGCCNDCKPNCADNKCNLLVKDLINVINNDKDDFFFAEAIDKEGNVVTDIDAYITTNAAVNSDEDATNDVCLGIKLTSKPSLVTGFCSIPSKPWSNPGTNIAVYLKRGFTCMGKVEVKQKLQLEQGSPAELKYKEYKAGGWNANPGVYRQSAIHGMPIGEFKSQIEDGKKYGQLILTWDSLDPSGWGDYFNSHTLIFVVEAVKHTDGSFYYPTRAFWPALLGSLGTPFMKNGDFNNDFNNDFDNE